MAYTPKMFGKDTEEEQAQLGMGGAPALGSSGMGVGTGSMGGGTGVPQAKDAPQSQTTSSLGPGTGFVNIDRMIGANQGIGSHVSQFGGKALTGEKEAFGKEVKKTSDAIKAGGANIPSMYDVNNAITGLTTPSAGASSSGGLIDTSATPNLGAFGTIDSALGAKYTGPDAMKYNIGNTGGIKAARALANNQSTGREIARETGTLASYDPRMSAIDSALYGNVADAVQARNDLGKGTKSQIDKEKASALQIKGMADSERQRAGDVRNSAATQLRDVASGIIGGARQQAGDSSGSGVSLRPENFIAPEQANTLQYISQALGDPSLAMGSAPRDLSAEAATRNAYRTDVASANTIKNSPAALPPNPTDEDLTKAEQFLKSPAATALPAPIFQRLQAQLRAAAEARLAHNNRLTQIGNTR